MGPARKRRARWGPNKRRVTTRRQQQERRCGKAQIVTERLCDGAINCVGLWLWRRWPLLPPLCSVARGARKQPRLASIVRGSARQVPRWAGESASVASGQSFSPVQQGANARWSPLADRWTNGYTQDVRSARRRRRRLLGRAAKQLFTSLLRLSDCELEDNNNSIG